MWVRKGVITIINLSNEYFLVTFTNDDDRNAALKKFHWFVYDHYLTVKEWSPNFHQGSGTIEKVEVWVRIAGLPIEYYDPRVLKFMGNRIRKSLKVDKNTLLQGRGKFARLCVEVDLSNPLLAQFKIKDRKYKVEYESLHLLCVTCGRFGHYKEGCLEKNALWDNMKYEGVKQNAIGVSNSCDGPWTVVQKIRRSRKHVLQTSSRMKSQANG
ncbi:uncharacterized protein LOC131596932 [Vicia villosa]|uniref:uncharacterized protein LOC131596932 n=1 Tax=Vicia villosa TaxID=3911 RepID=UPI00273AF489|nr:uncharacterized protein LOC131596932 [Vicia villosa]